MTTSTTENKQQATQSNESAFDQEGPGTTMAPPKFGLMASPAESGMAGKEGGESAKEKEGSKIEVLFKKLVAEAKGDYTLLTNAARMVMRHYGMYDEDLLNLKVVSSVSKGAYAITSPNPGAENMQSISISRELFDFDFASFVRIVGHEYQHVLYAWNHPENQNDNEDEFLAYYWELFGTDVADHANSRKIFEKSEGEEGIIPKHKDFYLIDDALLFGIKYFKKMPKALKLKYQNQYDQMLMAKEENDKKVK